MGRQRLYSDEQRLERARAAQIKFKLNHPERAKEIKRNCANKAYAQDPAKFREIARNRPKADKYLAVKKWTIKNYGYKLAHNAKRRALKLQRTVKWADLKAIEQFYIDCPKDMTVDHILPLQGKEISGLHVLENLQYLTKSENSRKGNRVSWVQK